MQKTELKAFIENLFKAWDNMDEEKITQIYNKDITIHMDDQNAHYDDIIHRVQYCKKHYTSIQNDIKDIVIDDDGKVAVRLHQTNTHLDTGNTTLYKIAAIYHIENNQVTEMWGTFMPNINYFE